MVQLLTLRYPFSLPIPSTVPTILAVTAFLMFIFTQPLWAEESCEPLVTNKCLSCHFETRICQKMEKKKGKSSWKRTIKSMIRHGTKLSKSEQKTLIQCFTSPDPAVLSLCKLDK